MFVGVIMAAGTLLVLDARLPGGLIEGSGNMRYAQTMAFTTLMYVSAFQCVQRAVGRAKRLRRTVSEHWLWGAVGLSLAAACGGDLRAVSAKGVFDRRPEL